MNMSFDEIWFSIMEHEYCLRLIGNEVLRLGRRNEPVSASVIADNIIRRKSIIRRRSITDRFGISRETVFKMASDELQRQWRR